MKISKVPCGQILVKSNLPEADYVINPYIGCEHKCCYCYARFMMRFIGGRHKGEKWGDFVDVKINAPEVLRKQLEKAKPGEVIMSSVTDAYQPIEKKFKLTRQLLEILLEKQFNVSILTKSDLVLRDIDLLKQFKEASVGFTINTLDEKFKKRIEPNSSSVKERLNALKELSKNKIETYIGLGPMFPFFTDLPAIFKEIKKRGVKWGFAERLNTNSSNWYNLKKILQKYYPDKVKAFEKAVLFKNDFNAEAEQQILKLSKKYNMRFSTYFGKQKLKDSKQTKL